MATVSFTIPSYDSVDSRSRRRGDHALQAEGDSQEGDRRGLKRPLTRGASREACERISHYASGHLSNFSSTDKGKVPTHFSSLASKRIKKQPARKVSQWAFFDSEQEAASSSAFEDSKQEVSSQKVRRKRFQHMTRSAVSHATRSCTKSVTFLPSDEALDPLIEEKGRIIQDQWSPEETQILMEAIRENSVGSRIVFWGEIAEQLEARAFTKDIDQCVDFYGQNRHRFKSKPRFPWTEEEKQYLVQLILKQKKEKIPRKGAKRGLVIHWDSIWRQMNTAGYIRHNKKSLRDFWHKKGSLLLK